MLSSEGGDTQLHGDAPPRSSYNGGDGQGIEGAILASVEETQHLLRSSTRALDAEKRFLGGEVEHKHRRGNGELTLHELAESGGEDAAPACPRVSQRIAMWRDLSHQQTHCLKKWTRSAIVNCELHCDFCIFLKGT